MSRMLPLVAALALATALPAWAHRKADIAKERSAVEGTIHGNICWALTKDRALAGVKK